MKQINNKLYDKTLSSPKQYLGRNDLILKILTFDICKRLNLITKCKIFITFFVYQRTVLIKIRHALK